MKPRGNTRIDPPDPHLVDPTEVDENPKGSRSFPLVVILVMVTLWVAVVFGTIAFVAYLGVGHDIQFLPTESEESQEESGRHKAGK